MAAVLKTIEQQRLEGSTPSPSADGESNDVSLAERQRHQPSKLDRWVRFPQDTFRFVDRGSSNGRISVFEAEDGGSNPSPRTVLADGTANRTEISDLRFQISDHIPGQLRLVALPGSELGGVGSIPTPGNS